MKRSYFFLLILLSNFLFACKSLTNRDKKLSIASSQSSEISFFKIHQKTDYFIDVEVSFNQVWLGCSYGIPKEEFAFLVFYILHGTDVYEFHYRKHSDARTCMDVEKEYLKMVKTTKTVRIVGTGLSSSEIGPPKDEPLLPSQFTEPSVKRTMFWTFIRLQSGSKCKSYFEDDCDLPKNYWAGTIPAS